jgi:N-methylhydantoinase B
MIRTSKLRPTSGINGGAHGAAPISRYTENGVERVLEGRSYTHLHAKPGDRLHHQVCGAGGFGDPYEREPTAVLTDVMQGRLSAAVARDQYGVVIADTAIDRAATAVLRGGRSAAGKGEQ